MTQEQHSPTEWIVKDMVDAGAQQVKETSKASLDATRAVMEIYREAASILRDRADRAFRSGVVGMEAGMDANFNQLNQMTESKNLQDTIRPQMKWGPNQSLAILRALSKANGFGAGGGAKPGKAANA